MTTVLPSSVNSVLTAMDALVSNPVNERKTCLSLLYFKENEKAEEKELREALGTYYFSNFKRTRFTLDDNGTDVTDALEQDYLNIPLTTCNVSFGGSTVSNVPTRFFRVAPKKNYMYALANGVPVRLSKFYGDNYINGQVVGAEVRTVELQVAGNSYEKLQGDDVGSSMMNMVNSYLTPQESPCIRLSYVGNRAQELPPSARHTLMIIPYVKKLYVIRRVKRRRNGKEKVEYGGVSERFSYGVRRYEKEKGKYGEAVTVDSAMLKRIEPICRYEEGFYRGGNQGARIKLIDEYAIHLCNENGSALVRLCPLVHGLHFGNLKHWMENLFTRIEFGGFVSRYKDVPGV